MKLLTKDSDYAIQALIYLAQNQGKSNYIPSREIATKNHIPLRYLRGILQAMAKEGIVVTKEGATGGFRLLKNPGKVRIIDIIQLFQGDVKISECMFRKKICNNFGACVLRRQLVQIEELLVKKFTNVTLRKLLNDFKSTKLKMG